MGIYHFFIKLQPAPAINYLQQHRCHWAPTSSIVNLSTTLQWLRFSDTSIWGSIPAAIGNLVGLERLYAHDTSISGVIPDSIGMLGNLMELYLYNTSMSGQIHRHAWKLDGALFIQYQLTFIYWEPLKVS